MSWGSAMSTNSIGKVLSSSPEAIIVLIDDLKLFEEHKSALQIGRYLRIAQGNNDFTVAASIAKMLKANQNGSFTLNARR